MATSNDYNNSTDYLKDLLVSETLPAQSWGEFGHKLVTEPVLGRYDGTPDSLNSFQPQHNYWSVVADLDAEHIGSPFLISRNLSSENLKPDYGSKEKLPLDPMIHKGKKLLVIFLGGNANMLGQRHLHWDVLNPDRLDHIILHPGDAVEIQDAK